MDQLMRVYQPLQMGLSIAALAVLCLAGAAFIQKDALPNPNQMHPSMFEEPQQTPTSHQSFGFKYAGASYLVEPLYDYQLNGLVVSHNNINGFADIYHDETSVDTKDLCVIYGDTLKSGVYQLGEYSSGSFTCYFQIPYGTGFKFSDLSNNHFITNAPHLRQTLAQVKVGDQIRVSGMLVNYSPLHMPSAVRKSSTTRNDTGGFACEVVFMEDFEIVARGNSLWRSIYSNCIPLLGIFLLLKLALMIIDVYQHPRPETDRDKIAQERLARINTEEQAT